LETPKQRSLFCLLSSPAKAQFVVWSQAHQASQRQPFRQVTNHIAGASPPIRQQPAVGVSQALQTRYKSQTVSVDRMIPTPSPILSSSTDMPYSPSMRSVTIELQIVFGRSRDQLHECLFRGVKIHTAYCISHIL